MKHMTKYHSDGKSLHCKSPQELYFEPAIDSGSGLLAPRSATSGSMESLERHTKFTNGLMKDTCLQPQ